MIKIYPLNLMPRPCLYSAHVRDFLTGLPAEWCGVAAQSSRPPKFIAFSIPVLLLFVFYSVQFLHQLYHLNLGNMARVSCFTLLSLLPAILYAQPALTASPIFSVLVYNIAAYPPYNFTMDASLISAVRTCHGSCPRPIS